MYHYPSQCFLFVDNYHHHVKVATLVVCRATLFYFPLFYGILYFWRGVFRVLGLISKLAFILLVTVCFILCPLFYYCILYLLVNQELYVSKFLSCYC